MVSEGVPSLFHRAGYRAIAALPKHAANPVYLRSQIGLPATGKSRFIEVQRQTRTVFVCRLQISRMGE